MFVAASQAAVPVSTLADVIRQVERMFSIAGDGTEIRVGVKHLKNLGTGAAPRVVFLPEESGELGPPDVQNRGYVASWTHGCGVVVLGVDTGEDEGRFDAVYALAARVISALKLSDPTHVRVGPARPKDDSPLDAGLAFAAVRFSFVYQANLAMDPAMVWAARQIAAEPPIDPLRPAGDSGKTFSVNFETALNAPEG